jgi:hypothetical protein
MNKVILIVIAVILIGCRNHSSGLSFERSKLNSYKDSLDKKYYDILNGLKLNYILYAKKPFRSFITRDSSESDQFEVTFRRDSIKYFDCYNSFFNQSIDFVDWLLKFKDDTTKGGLWFISKDPLSSYISECNLPLTNSRAAIILVENFLNGEGIICYECNYKDYECNQKTYELIEIFLKKNRNRNIAELRKEWKNHLRVGRIK